MPEDGPTTPAPGPRRHPPRGDAAILAATLLLAAVPRFLGLGWWCLWFDEVVSMTIARRPGLGELLRSLDAIDATRAPLHPILLHHWLLLFGTGEFAARSLSAACGLATVAVVFDLARRLFDRRTALRAAWLAAACPALVVYSREARMYALLVLLACVAWDLRSALRERWTLPRALGFGLSLAAMIYAHPIGLFLDLSLATACLLDAIRDRRAAPAWAATFASAGAACLPVVGGYLDHSPALLAARPALKVVLGMPIGFVGGDSRVLAACLGLVAWGLVARRHRRLVLDRPDALAALGLWFLLPPLLLVGYSLVKAPVFGPARYTLFVAPAYLILLARGLAKLPSGLEAAVGVALSALMISTLCRDAFEADQKADWQAAGREIAARSRGRDAPRPLVVVLSADPSANYEVETARYYLGRHCEVLAFERAGAVLDAGPSPRRPEIWFGIGYRNGRPAAKLPEAVANDPETRTQRFPGLQLVRWGLARR